MHRFLLGAAIPLPQLILERSRRSAVVTEASIETENVTVSEEGIGKESRIAIAPRTPIVLATAMTTARGAETEGTFSITTLKPFASLFLAV